MNERQKFKYSTREMAFMPHSKNHQDTLSKKKKKKKKHEPIGKVSLNSTKKKKKKNVKRQLLNPMSCFCDGYLVMVLAPSPQPIASHRG